MLQHPAVPQGPCQAGGALRTTRALPRNRTRARIGRDCADAPPVRPAAGPAGQVGRVAQLVEHLTFNQVAAGSSPAPLIGRQSPSARAAQVGFFVGAAAPPGDVQDRPPSTAPALRANAAQFHDRRPGSRRSSCVVSINMPYSDALTAARFPGVAGPARRGPTRSDPFPAIGRSGMDCTAREFGAMLRLSTVAMPLGAPGPARVSLPSFSSDSAVARFAATALLLSYRFRAVPAALAIGAASPWRSGDTELNLRRRVKAYIDPE